MVPICTTSKLEAVIGFRLFKSVLFQRLSGAPLMKIPLPLSARISPYFFIAVRITWFAAENPEMSKLALSLRRVPIGGAFGSVMVEAQCDAGATNAFCDVGTVNRNA